MEIKFRNKIWHLEVIRNMNFFQSCFDVAGHYLYSKKFGIIPRKCLIIVHNGSQNFIFGDKSNTPAYHKNLERICLSPVRLKRLEKVYNRLGNNLLEKSKKLIKYLTLKSFRDFVLAEKQLSAGLYLTTALGRHILEILHQRIKNIYPDFPPNEIDILISDITYPPHHTPMIESQLSLYKIGSELQKKKIKLNKINNYPSIYRKFQDIFQKYRSIPVGYNENPWTEKQILHQLSNLMKNNCHKESHRIQKYYQKRIKKSNKLLNKIKDKKIRLMADALRVGTALNEYRKFIFSQASLAYRPFFKNLAKCYKLESWRECWKFTPDEIIDLYFKDNDKIFDSFKKREWTGVISDCNKHGYSLLNGKEILPLIQKIQTMWMKKEKSLKLREIQGMIANKGIVIGKTKVILSNADFNKFKDGDIIVTTMTSVDFVPLMKRAIAFVTNEGGITSHAAIMSRELNKPCIIGTKIATTVLKDGDLVEVDANRGVVKIIKKAK